MSGGFTRGLVNAHTHLYSGLVPFGLPEPSSAPETFLEILEQVWWRLDRALDEESLRAGARYYVAEALLRGTTGIIDHHESPNFIEGSLDVLADACEELGMPAVLCYGATERNGHYEEAKRGFGECARFIASNHRPLVRGIFGVHAAFTVSDQTLSDIGGIAREVGSCVHIHVAEGVEDERNARSRGYRDTLHRLLDLDALPAGSVLAHGVHLGIADVRSCQQRDLWLVQNPRSNRGNGVGYPEALAESNRVALGTDGYPSDMVAEGRALAEDAQEHGENLVSALRRLDRGHDLFADLFHVGGVPEVVVGLGQITVAGRDVVKGGELQTGDIEEIRAHASEQAQRLWKRMADL